MEDDLSAIEVLDAIEEFRLRGLPIEDIIENSIEYAKPYFEKEELEEFSEADARLVKYFATLIITTSQPSQEEAKELIDCVTTVAAAMSCYLYDVIGGGESLDFEEYLESREFGVCVLKTPQEEEISYIDYEMN